MKKSMLILLICTVLTACGNHETETAVTENVAIETATQLQTEDVTQSITTEITTEPVVTTTITTTLPQTTSTTPTTTEAFIAEKKNEIKARVTTAKVKYAEAVKMTTTTEVPETVTTTTATTTSTTTTTEVTKTEPPQNNQTDYEKALAVYEYMTANGSGTCVQYAYATYEMCREYGLECYFTWTESKLYGHVANVVKVDGVWYVLDTQGRCFLTENMCGFTEIVDEYENHVADASLISTQRY